MLQLWIDNKKNRNIGANTGGQAVCFYNLFKTGPPHFATVLVLLCLCMIGYTTSVFAANLDISFKFGPCNHKVYKLGLI